MPYHFPIKTGDRVALAPHLDLWMAGCRFGTVTSVGGEGSMGGRFYFVDLDTGRNVTLNESDLLGAVRHPSGASAPARLRSVSGNVSDASDIRDGDTR